MVIIIAGPQGHWPFHICCTAVMNGHRNLTFLRSSVPFGTCILTEGEDRLKGLPLFRES